MCFADLGDQGGKDSTPSAAAPSDHPTVSVAELQRVWIRNQLSSPGCVLNMDRRTKQIDELIDRFVNLEDNIGDNHEPEAHAIK